MRSHHLIEQRVERSLEHRWLDHFNEMARIRLAEHLRQLLADFTKRPRERIVRIRNRNEHAVKIRPAEMEVRVVIEAIEAQDFFAPVLSGPVNVDRPALLAREAAIFEREFKRPCAGDDENSLVHILLCHGPRKRAIQEIRIEGLDGPVKPGHDA